MPNNVNNGQNPTAPVSSNMAPTAKSAPAMADDNPAKRPMLIAKIPAPMRIGRSAPPTLHVMIIPPLFTKKMVPVYPTRWYETRPANWIHLLRLLAGLKTQRADIG